MGIETKYYTNANEPKSLGLASAAVGQIPKIKAVDSNGVPTEWEAADMASGADGKSAYVYAVEGGYTGTEEEFAAKLAEEIPAVDDTLTQSGQAADASVVGNRLSALSEEIVTTSESKVAAHNTRTDTHSDIRLLIQGLTDRLNALADSDDTTLDQLSEVVAYIKSNRSLIEAITTSKVSVADIIDNLTTNVSNKPLSAAQGVALKALIDAISIPDALPNPNAITFTGAVTSSYDGSAPISVNIPTVPTKTSQLTNDSGFLTSHQDISGKQDKATLEADVAAKGFTKNTGTYSKPAGGIPKSDLDAAVQTSLGKADTALQEHQSLAAYRTAAAQDVIDSGKVDKVDGKGLSTNDYTAADKAKVDAIPVNPKYTDTVYDDTALKERVATIEGKESAWDAKSDFSGSYNDLTDKPTIPTALPNPNAITFTGAVTSSYNGSEPVTINIPESGAGNMKKLTFTGAVTGEYDGTTDVNIDIPTATASTAGIIKVGNGLSISADGTLSVTTATYYTGTADPVNTLGADDDLYLKKRGDNE